MLQKLFDFSESSTPDKKEYFSIGNVLRLTIGFLLVIYGLIRLLTNLLDKNSWSSQVFSVESLPGIITTIVNVSSTFFNILIIIIGLMLIPRKASENTQTQPELLGNIGSTENKKRLFVKVWPFIVVIVFAFPFFLGWAVMSNSDYSGTGGAAAGIVFSGVMLAYSSILFIVLLLAIISFLSKKRKVYLSINILLSIFTFILILFVLNLLGNYLRPL